MFEGKVTIELHNHKTGLRDRIEGKNTVTSGLQNTYNAMLKILPDYPAKYLPVTTTILGGLIVMDTTLDGDDTIIPSGASVIANGYYNGTNTSSTFTGTYNSLESGFNETDVSMTHVYDFATTQGNGTIKSVALTSILGGQYPFTVNNMYGESNMTGINMQSNQYPLVYNDTENKDLYYLNTADRYVYKVKLYDVYSIRLNEAIRTVPVGVSTGKQLTLPTNYYYYDGKDGYVYSISASGTNMNINRVKVDDYSFTETLNYKTITFPAAIKTSKSSISIDIDNGKAYAFSNANSLFYIYDLDNNSTQQIDLSTYGMLNDNSNIICLLENGDVYLSTRTSSSNTIFKSVRISGNIIQCDTSVTHSKNIVCGQQSGSVLVAGSSTTTAVGSIFPISNILMTNYNLPSIINKTTSQSMKISYTVRQVS